MRVFFIGKFRLMQDARGARHHPARRQHDVHDRRRSGRAAAGQGAAVGRDRQGRGRRPGGAAAVLNIG